MSKLKFLDELTHEADSAKVPELRVFEANKSSVDPHFEKEVKRIAHMVETVARASKNSTTEVWALLETHLRGKGDISEGLLATFREKIAESQPEKVGAVWLKARDEAQ